MSETIINVFKGDGGWFVMTSERFGPYSRELAEQLAKGMAFAVRSSGGTARITFGDTDEPSPTRDDAL